MKTKDDIKSREPGVSFVEHSKTDDSETRRDDLFVGIRIILACVPLPRAGWCFEEREERYFTPEDEAGTSSSFDEEQMEEFRNNMLFKEDSKPRKFMKTDRMMVGAQIMSWKQMAEALREAARRRSVAEVQKLTREFCNQEDDREL
jgi:hypothetical protein